MDVELQAIKAHYDLLSNKCLKGEMKLFMEIDVPRLFLIIERQHNILKQYSNVNDNDMGDLVNGK